MDARRATPRYQALRDDFDLGENSLAHRSDIELMQYQDISVHGPAFNSTSSFDRTASQDATSTRSQEPTCTTATVYSSRDDDHLLPNSKGHVRPQQSNDRRRFSGWRTGVLVSLIGATSVFLLNLTLTLWVLRNGSYEIQGGIGMLLQGSCARVRRLNVWVHLLVNVLSTLLLCASNYCMQILNAPSRSEIDQAHSRRQWLQIGVPSLHNLKRIGRDRRFPWMLLMLSSLPLHLLYNSVIFTKLQANEYTVIPSMEDWLYGARYNTSGFLGIHKLSIPEIRRSLNGYRPNLTETMFLDDGSRVPRYKNVSTKDCFEQYSNQYVPEIGNVYLIQSASTVWRNLSMWHLGVNSTGEWVWGNFTNVTDDRIDAQKNVSGALPIFDYRAYELQNLTITLPVFSRPIDVPSNGWRCRSHRTANCSVADEREVPRDRSQWAPFEEPLRYCIVEQVPEMCKLGFSFPIAGMVIVANLVKACCMAWLLLRYKKHEALVTLGDALASFLERPDPHTRGWCLQDKNQIEGNLRGNLNLQPLPLHLRKADSKFEVYKAVQPRWSRAPSHGTWFAGYSFYFCAIFAGVVFIIWSLKGMPRSAAALWKIGFGTVSGQNIMTFKTSLMGIILLANTPQLVLSYLYLSFNILYTNMFIGYEWASYSRRRKGLRVTRPVGEQRGTYWLSVPFRFAVPMIILSGLFHWLASSSLFMVQITVTVQSGRGLQRTVSDAQSIATCGYTPVAIILTTVVATVIAIGGIVIGRFRYPAGMPVAGSNSAAISASCHPPEEDVDAHLKPVMWGAVSHGTNGGSEEDGVGHCTFSSLEVEPPFVGRRYA